ncbi:DegV family protein [Lactococcus fujiensis]|nr:DegV family protein [Lactococcus fujiensis]
MKFKIIADSSADLNKLEGVPFTSAPLKINTAEKEYVDDANLNVEKNG